MVHIRVVQSLEPQSTIEYGILGCSWPGRSLIQYGKTMQYVPAFMVQFSNVKVILRGETAPVKAITVFFQDKKKTVDLSKWVDPLAKSLSIGQTQYPESSETTANITYVRYQYDGILSMSLKVNTTETPSCRNKCQDPSSLFYQSCDSLHVVNFLSVLEVNVSVYFVLPGGQRCDLVETGTNVTLRNHLAYENSKFYQSLSSAEKENLKICYLSCVNVVTYVDHADAGLHNFILYTGRPEITRPYTRSLNIQVDGYSSSGEFRTVSHFGKFVIQGFYKDCDGLSFAFPTHSPVMILRDPPGGASSASYENVMTRFTVGTQETTVSEDYTISSNAEMQTGVDALGCLGGGFLVMAMVCLPVKSIATLKLFELSNKQEERVEYWKNEVTLSRSISWSIQTSSDPWLAGSMSDIFAGKYYRNICHLVVLDLIRFDFFCAQFLI